jgi:hypothetical protein
MFRNSDLGTVAPVHQRRACSAASVPDPGHGSRSCWHSTPRISIGSAPSSMDRSTESARVVAQPPRGLWNCNESDLTSVDHRGGTAVAYHSAKKRHRLLAVLRGRWANALEQLRCRARLAPGCSCSRTHRRPPTSSLSQTRSTRAAGGDDGSAGNSAVTGSTRQAVRWSPTSPCTFPAMTIQQSAYHGDLFGEARANEDFRRILATSKHTPSWWS